MESSFDDPSEMKNMEHRSEEHVQYLEPLSVLPVLLVARGGEHIVIIPSS